MNTLKQSVKIGKCQFLFVSDICADTGELLDTKVYINDTFLMVICGADIKDFLSKIKDFSI